jgi:uncharacterized membrane protein YcaP (DUF421 family)
MEETATHSFDLYRIFIGDQPAIFFLEILFRTVVMYLYVLLVLRLMGKRGMGQLSPFEFTIIIALGSAVGDPMFYPEVPLLHCLAVVTVVVAITRFVTYLSNRSESIEDFLEGQPRCIVDDGALDLEALDGERFSREELFMLLREKGVRQLGQVQRAYLEPSGGVSAFRAPEDRCKPGLPVIPPYDEWTPPRGMTVDSAARKADLTYACWKCGHTEEAANGAASTCGRCEGDAWVEATRDPLA